MTRRLSLLALALLAALAVPTRADSCTAGLSPLLDPDPGPVCKAAARLASPMSESFLPRAAASGFILCTCELCIEHPAVICQVSPSGFSIHCSDWARQHCPSTGPPSSSTSRRPLSTMRTDDSLP